MPWLPECRMMLLLMPGAEEPTIEMPFPLEYSIEQLLIVGEAFRINRFAEWVWPPYSTTQC
jgi:hypothetical protein